MHLLPHLRTYEYEIKTIDSHTEGESTRIVYDGFPRLRGATMMEKKRDLLAHYDFLLAVSKQFSGIGLVRRHGQTGSMRLLKLEEVCRMRVRAPGLKKKAALKAWYEQNGWTRKLTRTELEERRLEARSSDRRWAPRCRR